MMQSKKQLSRKIIIAATMTTIPEDFNKECELAAPKVSPTEVVSFLVIYDRLKA